MKNFKFTIITPSIGRTTLIETIESIQSQNYPEYEHLIVFDGEPRWQSPEMVQKINEFLKDPHIKMFGTQQTKNFGNFQRQKGNEESSGDYTTYLDDDDKHINLSLFKLNEQLNIKESDFLVFPALRFGEVFYNKPPGLGVTMSCQYVHKRIINGKLIKWLENSEDPSIDQYTLDGRFVEYLRDSFGVDYLDGEPLSEVNFKSVGKML